MKTASHWLDVPAAASVAMGRADALRRLLSEERPAAFYGAPLTGDSLSLGAYQRRALAVSATTSIAVARRISGGSAVYAGAGVFYFALALKDASVLMECPPGRILNRNVRGLLQGVRGLGVPAHYFGRDFVSVATRPGAYVAWDERDDGRVLVEAFISHDRSYVPRAEHMAYPPLQADPYRGHAPITLNEAASRPIDAGTLFEQLLRGYAAMYKIDSSALDADAIAQISARRGAPVLASDPALHDTLSWSAPYEEAIGFVYAGARLGADRSIAQVSVCGDYFQNQLGQRALEQALIGCAADGTALGRAINDVYADPRHVIEGIRQMDSLRAVVLAAAEQAAANNR